MSLDERFLTGDDKNVIFGGFAPQRLTRAATVEVQFGTPNQ